MNAAGQPACPSHSLPLRRPILCLSALLALAGLYASCYRLVEVLGG